MIAFSEHSGPAQVVTALRVVRPNSGFPDTLLPSSPLSLSSRGGGEETAGGGS